MKNIYSNFKNISSTHHAESKLLTNRLLYVYCTVERVFGESKRQQAKKASNCVTFFTFHLNLKQKIIFLQFENLLYT